MTQSTHDKMMARFTENAKAMKALTQQLESTYHPCTSILIEGLKKLNAWDVLAEWDRAREVVDERVQTTRIQQQAGAAEPSIWVLTSEYNDYDQHGEYFEDLFVGKPTLEQIQKCCQVNEEYASHILSGGGRVNYEDKWYNLRQEAAHGIKEGT